MNTSAIPAELLALGQMVAWRPERRGEKITKIPVNPRTGGQASTTDPATWGTFAEADAAASTIVGGGIGFVFATTDGYTGVDLDGCRDPETGEIATWAQAIIDGLDSYTEISPSGKGVHIIVKAIKPGEQCKVTRPHIVEVYSAARFFTLTGDHLAGTPSAPQDRQDELADFYRRLFPEVGPNRLTSPHNTISLDDSALIDKAIGARNGQLFRALWNGDTSAHNEDDSAADLALCRLLMFWTGNDPARTDRLFRRSGLYRAKWERSDYRAKTLEKAMAAEVYTEPRKRTEPNGVHSPEPTPIRPEAESIAPSRTTDVANAERFARQHGDRLRFCHPFNKWLANDNRRWALDNVAEVDRCGKETARSIYREAAEEPTDTVRIELSKHAIRSESEARIRAMISLGKSEPGIPVLPEALDADPWLFNVENGTINLKTATLQPHNRADLITKLAPVVYEPTATAPTFDAFLARILPSESLRRFVQRAAGYSLTGDTREDVLLIAFGHGHNGKTSLMQTLQALMGDYAIQTRPETLMIKRTEGIPNDVAGLKGARLVAASEAEEGKRLAESLIKQLTGGDRISARFLHGEFFEFDPAFKIWLSTNHKPIIRGTDRGIWRRIRLIPFDVTIPDAECDETLPEKLRGELPGILNWALAGCRDWLENGLGMPDEVKQATQAYRDEMDIIGNWLTECCVEHRHASASANQLYASYLRWCEGNGEKSESQNKLGARLTERGYTRKPMRDGIHWLGIGLRTSPDQNPPECEPCEPCEPNSMVSAREGISKTKTLKMGSQGSQGSQPAQTSVFSLAERDIPPEPTDAEIAWEWIVAVKAEREFGMSDAVCVAAVRLGCALDRFASAEDEAVQLADYLDRHAAMTVCV